MRKLIVLILIITSLPAPVSAQADEDVLFTVGDREVTVGEFRYIYEKTNGEAANYERASLDEYLDLYQRFKLKVARAYAMRLDTVKALQNELAGYRRQLADNYLIDRAVTDDLVEELYARKQQDVDISHILIAVKSTATPADTLAAYQRILEAKAGLTAGNFAERAMVLSEDEYSKKRGGRIGYLSAPFPRGMYRLESAVYDAKPGTVVGPVRTSFGYHLATVHGSRPAKGEVEAAHIFVRKPENGEPDGARKKMEQIKAFLDSGQSFEQLAATMSEDEKTKRNGGYLGFFGINRYAKPFETAAFAIPVDGGVSDIVETSAGFHLIKRISQRGVQPFADERPLLTGKVKEDPRFATATEDLLKTIRQRAGVTEDKAAFGQFAAGLVDSTFLSFNWKGPDPESKVALLSFRDGHVVTLGDFQSYLEKESRQRAAQRRRGKSYNVALKLYEDFVDEELLAYEESKLEENYPDFRALMREYEEGILLFEATKLEVWDKASEDSVGLAAYFADHRDQYVWDQRARVTKYTVSPALTDQILVIREAAGSADPQEIVERFRLPQGEVAVTTRTDTYERGRLAQMQQLDYALNAVSEVERNAQNGQLVFYKVEELLPGGPKELDEARGYVIADYQDELERKWVNGLRKQFPLKLRKRSFEKLVRD